MWPIALPQRLRQWLQPRRASAIAEACLIGLVAALSAVLLKVGAGELGSWRVHASHLLPAWIVLPAIGFSFGFLAGLLVEQLAPEASGSGIPQVKAALANVPTTLSWRVGLVKLVSSIIVLGSGLALGRQGPTVHVGAALAGQLSHWVPTSPEHRRQMIAAGAGAGLAAAFNAPLTGVLFVVEELLHDLSGLTLGTAILASFIGAVVSRLLGGRSINLNLQLAASQTSFSLTEIPFYLVLGVLAGLLAALFNRGIIVSMTFYRGLRLSLPLRVGLAGLISGVVLALLPVTFRDNTGLRELLVTGESSVYTAAIAFIAQFILTLIAFGSGASGGLFAPSLILGSALGYIVGTIEYNILHFGLPITYALAGMGAFFSAVSKVPITAIVIVFEMTTDFNLVLPLMFGSVTAYLVADKVAPGSIYDRILEWKGIHLEKQTPTEGFLTELTAEDVMQRRVETLSGQMALDEVVQAFSRSHHRGFPVVDDGGKLVGIVTQTDLAKMRDLHLPGGTPLSAIMTPKPVTVRSSNSLGYVLYLLDRYKLSRLPVMDGRKLVGIITRADIIRVEADYLNAETSQTGPQPEPSYVVYQTRSPSTGQGRLLILLSNPQTAALLLQLAAAIAKERDYELECLQVILVPRHSSPAETLVNTTKSRRLLRQAESLGRKWKIPMHTQIRATHDLEQAVLETIKERHIDLILMGWKGNTITPGRIFGNVVDTLIRQAPCEVVLVRLGGNSAASLHEEHQTLNAEQQETHLGDPPGRPYTEHQMPQFNRWLVPMAGGPNARAAIQLLPALVTLGDASEIRLCQVFALSESEPDITILEQASHELVHHRNFSSPVTAASVKASSVAEGVIDLVKTNHFDVVILGASREGLLQQAINGNIPAAIASRVESTVILVRGAIGSK